MDTSTLDPIILQRLKDLEEKYSLTGQDLASNLEGLMYANYLKYWDYIHLDTLLSLQSPRTDFPDEKIFIIYHQITELYFKLILLEIEQIASHKALTNKFFLERILRINRYFKNLTFSFDIMVDGMEWEQFRQFRMALLPASGFQSAQFRKIEICSTDFIYLLSKEAQNELTQKADIEEIYQFIYWKQGASDQSTGKETITSLHFQEHYNQDFIELGKAYREKNLRQIYLGLAEDKDTPEIHQALKEYDQLINVEWRLSHFRSAVRYLKSGSVAIEATGGTNWQKYLPPRFQRTIFFPELWTKEELDNWGKKWVENQFNV
jgi:tryptophan 2,3-dioxygenase